MERRRWGALLGRCEGGEGFFEAGGVFDVGGGEGAVDLAVEAGEDFAGADFDVVGDVVELELADAVDPADGAGDLADEGVADGVGLLVRRRASTLAATGKRGSWKGMDWSGFGELELGGHHEGAVEGGADGEHDGALGTESLQSSAARATAAAEPEMTVWSGELRLAVETTSLGRRVACGDGR